MLIAMEDWDIRLSSIKLLSRKETMELTISSLIRKKTNEGRMKPIAISSNCYLQIEYLFDADFLPSAN